MQYNEPACIVLKFVLEFWSCLMCMQREVRSTTTKCFAPLLALLLQFLAAAYNVIVVFSCTCSSLFMSFVCPPSLSRVSVSLFIPNCKLSVCQQLPIRKIFPNERLDGKPWSCVRLLHNILLYVDVSIWELFLLCWIFAWRRLMTMCFSEKKESNKTNWSTKQDCSVGN